MRRPFWNPFRTHLLVLAFLIAATTVLLAGTPQGAQVALRLIVPQALHPTAFSIDRIEGSLLHSLTLSGIYLENPIRSPKGTRLAISQMRVITGGSLNPRRWQWLLLEPRLSVPDRVEQLSCAYVQGSADGGMRLLGAVITNPERLPKGSRVEARSAQIRVPLLSGPKEWPIVIYGIHAVVPRMAGFFYAERAEGNWSQGLTVYEVEAGDFSWLPTGSAIRIQRAEFSGASARFEPQRVQNGRLQLPASDPVLFSGIARPEALQVQLYAKHIEIQTASAVFTRWQAIKIVTGTFTDVQAVLTGTWKELTFDGRCAIERLQRKGAIVSDSTGAFHLTLSNLGKGLRLNGQVSIHRGVLNAKQTTIHLQQGQILFTGVPRNPAYDLKGVSTIDGVRVNITLKGTQDQPDLRLSSDPPIQEDWLLLMLATGRRWRGAETSAMEGQISPDLAKDFIDFFLLGGLGTRMAQHLGISDISLIFNPQERRVGVATTIGDKVEFRYETDQPRPRDTGIEPITTDATTTTYRVGAGYKLTDDSSVRIEGERQLNSASPSSTSSGSGSAVEAPEPLTPESEPNDSIFLKFQKKF